MHHLKTTTTQRSTSVFLSHIHATTVSIWPDGFYYQRQMFYNSRWTREMEQTFVESLVEHVLYEWAQTRVERLRERYHLFRWVVNTEGVIWNTRLGFVTAPDHVWQSLCRQNKRAKWYCNAYEDLWGQLCILFDPRPNGQNDVIDADRFDRMWPHLKRAGAVEPAPDGPNNEPVPNVLHAAQVPDAPQAEPAPDVANTEPAPDAMHAAQALDAPLVEPPHHAPRAIIAHDAPQAEPVPDDTGQPKHVLYNSDSSSESSSMWRALHEYYGSDNDADSILPPPGVPLWKRAKAAHYSPASQKSAGASSSTALNATPLKKQE
ncbi:hypothetical protein Salat_2788400 [Sesamum alatum]|uniref:Uncharacterized protein n=1 Tax=Sesamum alatum TaxID=300844 RepID=A0AAE1XKZ1_9LAMI|nr:hypothetical protein Salat_2788400 [Sesamum alatum]